MKKITLPLPPRCIIEGREVKMDKIFNKATYKRYVLINVVPKI